MVPFMPHVTASPLEWKCSACLHTKNWPIIEWPFDAFYATDESLHAVGIRTIDREGNLL
jgi:hypothetical protein